MNATPLSQHVAHLLTTSGEPIPTYSLVLLTLLGWATEHQYPSPTRGEMELGAAVRAAQDDPETLYANLADERLMTAPTLRDAAQVIASAMGELLDDRSLTEALRV